MADYEVGNLQIKFSALDEIDFKKISQGLNSVKRAIIGITNIDTDRLDRFSDILSDLSTQFLPFLQGVEKASGGLAVFNDTLRQVGGRGGARGLSAAVEGFENIKKYTQEELAIAEQLGINLREATEEQLVQIQAIIENNRRLEEQRRIIGELTNRYATYRDEFYRASREKPAILEDINTTKAAIQEAQQELNQLKTQFVVVGENLGFNEETSQFAQEITAEIQSMEGVIDNLKVHLADLQAQFGAPFNEAQRAVSALKNELLNVYYATHTINEGQVQEWQRLTAAINETERAVNRALMSEEEKVIADYQAQQAAIRQRIAYLEAALALNKLGDDANAAREELRRLKEEMGQGEKQTKKSASGWKKFLNQIKRIAIYRLIRTALRAIVSTFKDTINAFAEVDDNVNQSMSQITTSLQFIKLGLGSTILPFLQMIAPIVEQIGYSFADLGNMISASLSKDGKFTKINTKAWKNYREEVEKTNGALLDFDKFRVLNAQQTSLSDFLLPNQSVEEYFDENGINETADRIKNIVYDVSSALKNLFDLIGTVGAPILRVVVALAEPIINAISRIIQGITNFIKKLQEVNLLAPILTVVAIGLIAWGGTKVISSITTLVTKLGTLKTGLGAVGIAAIGLITIIDSWGDMSTWQRIIGIIGVATTAILGLALAFGAFHSAWSLGLAVTGIVAGIAMIVGAVASAKGEIEKSVSIPQYAQGGLPDKGTMFIAGEAGAEMVYNMPSGQSGVANVTQIEQAFYNALIRYGRENNGGAINVNVNLDGQQLYRSVERAAGQRGLGFARK